MANKTLKTKQKSLASEIVSSIETKLGDAGTTTKKIKKSIEKSADKLAKKLTKLTHKAEKKAEKPVKKSKKETVKATKKALKAEEKAEQAAAKAIHTIVDSASGGTQQTFRQDPEAPTVTPAAAGNSGTSRPKAAPSAKNAASTPEKVKNPVSPAEPI